MLERIFGRKMEAPLQQKQEMLRKKAEKFLREERKKEKFTEKKFREYEQEKRELEKMPSSGEFRESLERMAKPGKDYVRVPRSDIGWVGEGLSRDDDLRIIRAMLEIKDFQGEFTAVKDRNTIELYFERIGDAHIPREKKNHFISLHLNDDTRDKLLAEMGVDSAGLIKTLDKMRIGEEKIFATDMSGMEVVLEHKEQSLETFDQKTLKNQFKAISLRFYDPEERAREIEEGKS